MKRFKALHIKLESLSKNEINEILEDYLSDGWQIQSVTSSFVKSMCYCHFLVVLFKDDV